MLLIKTLFLKTLPRIFSRCLDLPPLLLTSRNETDRPTPTLACSLACPPVLGFCARPPGSGPFELHPLGRLDKQRRLPNQKSICNLLKRLPTQTERFPEFAQSRGTQNYNTNKHTHAHAHVYTHIFFLFASASFYLKICSGCSSHWKTHKTFL